MLIRRGRAVERGRFYDLLLALLLCSLAAACSAIPLNGLWQSSSSGTGADALRLTAYVNPFIGTAPGGSHFGFNGNSGDTFPGAAYPMGMVQWSPDTPSNLPGGYYYPDNLIKGFSLTHFSGRGCLAYQDIPFMPYVGLPLSSPLRGSAYQAHFSHADEVARPGYYRVHLEDSDVMVELSATPHTGVGQFTYPPTGPASMLINAGGSINGNSASEVTIVPAQQMVTGMARSIVGCGRQHYTLYFAARFDQAFSGYGTWNGSSLQENATHSAGRHSGAFIIFASAPALRVEVQVGLSFISVANAELNLDAENIHNDFSAAVTGADRAWNRWLGAIQVQGGTPAEKTAFYTALYHSFLHPNIFSDVNGQYLGFDGQIHQLAPRQHAQYENIPGWDAYRSLIRLRAILDPQGAADIAQSLINDALQGDGHLPRWEQVNVDTRGMVGDGGALMVAEAYAFGATTFNTTAALAAMITGQASLREGYSDYLSLGYLPADRFSGSAAITLEYSNADMAIAQFAKAVGDQQDAALFQQRSANWQNLFNPDSGYIQPRNADGSWASGFSPASGSGFVEGSAAQYSWLVPYDTADLFALMGGAERVVARLDDFFQRLNDGPASTYAFMGNEPCEEVPWEYDFAGAPWRTQAIVRRIERTLFSADPGGLPGNDDGGALSSWYVFAALGLYPEVTGVGGFVIGSPLFSEAIVHLGSGKLLRIEAPEARDNAPYVQDLQVDGTSTQGLWLPWATVARGLTLHFTLATVPSQWGSRPEDAPPSFAAS
jgi:predicted alpha-1,2-mannosidase